MAFITKSTYTALRIRYEKVFLDDFFEKIQEQDWRIKHLIKYFELQRNDFNWYSVLEKKELHIFKVLPKRIDSKEFVYKKGGNYVYHRYKDCENFKGFIDYKIPNPVREYCEIIENDDLIDEYRKWFIQTFTIPEEITDKLIVEKYNEEFAVKNNLRTIIKEELSEINNGIILYEMAHFFDNYEFNLKMNEIIRKRNNCKLDNTLEDNKFALNFSAISLIFELLKWSTFIKDKSKQYVTLDDFGLRQCYTCQQRYELEKK